MICLKWCYIKLRQHRSVLDRRFLLSFLLPLPPPPHSHTLFPLIILYQLLQIIVRRPNNNKDLNEKRGKGEQEEVYSVDYLFKECHHHYIV